MLHIAPLNPTPTSESSVTALSPSYGRHMHVEFRTEWDSVQRAAFSGAYTKLIAKAGLVSSAHVRRFAQKYRARSRSFTDLQLGILAAPYVPMPKPYSLCPPHT